MQRGRKGQITAFIIIGVMLVSAVSLFFLFKKGFLPEIGQGRETDVTGFMDTCLENKIEEGIELIAFQGGFINSSLYKTFKFEEEGVYRNISYLCYTLHKYEPCVNQVPMYIPHLKKELKNYLESDVRDCFDELTKSLERQDYVVEAKYNDFDIDLALGKVITNIDADIVLTKADEISKQSGFKIITPSKIYDLAIVVQEINSQEARFCNFNAQGFMMMYHDFDIEKYQTSELEIIYTVTHKTSGEKFRFAVRSCVMPPGFM